MFGLGFGVLGVFVATVAGLYKMGLHSTVLYVAVGTFFLWGAIGWFGGRYVLNELKKTIDQANGTDK